MRVLFFPKEFPSTQQPNNGIFILRRAQAVQGLGHDVRVLRIVPAAPPLGSKWNAYRSIPHDEVVGGIPVRTIRTLIPPRMIAMEYVPLLVRGALVREVARMRADLVHASFLLPCGHAAVRQHLVPAIVTAHGVDAYKWPNLRPGLRRASRYTVTHADGVTAVSGFIGERLRDLGAKNPRVIWNGGDERFFYPRVRSQCRAELNLPEDRRILAFAGNVLRAKGLFDLVEALARISPERRPLAVIAGRGSDEAELRSLAASRGVELRFTGLLDSERIGMLFGAADAVVLPSHAEGLPNVVCEAMLSERAVVASTVGGIPEIVRNERSGILVAAHAPEELSNAIERVVNDDAMRDALAAEARAFAREHLTWRVSALAYEAFYREVLERAGRLPRSVPDHSLGAMR
ncbi:MAG TPA: glycosyltransferase [Candidatus Baltobacteraceae bacterium]|nr:glycosyltransferase [Candidatus Baltobacteraceae bacterium]